jgi:exonuclease VII small subunit
MRKLTALLVVAAMPLGVVACGGDDDEGPSKEEFVEEANAVCTRTNSEIEQVSTDAFKDPEDPKPAEAQAYLAELVPILEQQQTDLEELEKPKDDEEEIEEILTAAETGITALEEGSKKREEALAVVIAGDETFAEANRLATAYGLDECAQE